MIKFPSIEQFRNVVKEVQLRAAYAGKDDDGKPIYDGSKPKPILTFHGTPKLHGTNAGIVMEGGQVYYQSRERVLTLESDNCGFMRHMLGDGPMLVTADMFGSVADHCGIKISDGTAIAIYGEWCGQGVQSGVAISQLPKMLVVFAVKVGDEWIDFRGLNLTNADARIFDIHDFPSWDITIDFENPQLSQNDLVDITNKVEDECPVGRAFGVSGVGEGVVWTCGDLMFKVKGEKHSATKVKTLSEVDAEAIKTVIEFVERTVTENRLEQGLHVLQNELQKPFTMIHMGDFIRWVYGDVVKEESDTIEASGIDPKKLGSPIADRCRRWYIAKFNSQ